MGKFEVWCLKLPLRSERGGVLSWSFVSNSQWAVAMLRRFQRDDHFIPLLYELRHEARPPGLVGGTSATAVVAVKIFKEPEVGTEVRIMLHLRAIAKDGPLSIRTFTENTDQPVGQVIGNLFQGDIISGARGMLHLEVIAVIMMETLQRFYDEIIHGEPYRSAPV